MDELQYINELQTEHSKVQKELHNVKARAVAKIKALHAEVARLNAQLKQQSQEQQSHDESPARQQRDDGSSASDASAASDASDFVKVRPASSSATALQQREEAMRLRETTLKELELSLREREVAAAEREAAAAEREAASVEREASLQQHELEAAQLREVLLEGLLQIRSNLAPALA